MNKVQYRRRVEEMKTDYRVFIVVCILNMITGGLAEFIHPSLVATELVYYPFILLTAFFWFATLKLFGYPLFKKEEKIE